MPLHVSSIICSASGGALQTAVGILRARYAHNVPTNVSWALPEDEQVILETCRDL
jgi:hypothetical protein